MNEDYMNNEYQDAKEYNESLQVNLTLREKHDLRAIESQIAFIQAALPDYQIALDRARTLVSLLGEKL